MKQTIALFVVAIACMTTAQTATKKEEKACCKEKAAASCPMESRQEEGHVVAEKACGEASASCCNMKGKAAKFKVYVANEGYKLFGCQGSARKGREELIAKGKTVGSIQKVSSKRTKIA